MSAILPTESKPTSRRALLAGALGGLGAMAASAIGRPSPVRGADGDPVIQGAENNAASATTVTNTTGVDFGDAFIAVSTGSVGIGLTGRGTAGSGVHATATTGSGVSANATSGTGVRSSSTSGRGVYGTSTSGEGVRGSSNTQVGVFGKSTDYVGVYGDSTGHNGVVGNNRSLDHAAVIGYSEADGTGVEGISGGGVAIPGKAKTGVYGEAAQDTNAKGVWGHSPAGRGVQGSTTSGYAGYFAGKVFSTKFYELAEIATPAAPGSASRARLFIRDSGGKTQLCVRFRTGAVKVLAAEA